MRACKCDDPEQKREPRAEVDAKKREGHNLIDAQIWWITGGSIHALVIMP